MKHTALILVLAAAMAGCGGGKSTLGNPVPPVDPSGNWQLQLASSGIGLGVTAVMNQVGANVTASNIRFVGQPGGYTCNPIKPSLTAVVSNGTQMDGQLSDASFGTISFTGQLSADGITFRGTYSGVTPNNCTDLPPSGSIQGTEIPSVTGTWAGTLQQVDSQGNPVGPAMPFSAQLAQNDTNGTVSGSYSVTNSTCLTSGTFNVDQSKPWSYVSGYAFTFSLIDNNGLVDSVQVTASGGGVLGMDKSFSGSVSQDDSSSCDGSSNTAYTLKMSH